MVLRQVTCTVDRGRAGGLKASAHFNPLCDLYSRAQPMANDGKNFYTIANALSPMIMLL